MHQDDGACNAKVANLSAPIQISRHIGRNPEIFCIFIPPGFPLFRVLVAKTLLFPHKGLHPAILYKHLCFQTKYFRQRMHQDDVACRAKLSNLSASFQISWHIGRNPEDFCIFLPPAVHFEGVCCKSLVISTQGVAPPNLIEALFLFRAKYCFF